MQEVLERSIALIDSLAEELNEAKAAQKLGDATIADLRAQLDAYKLQSSTTTTNSHQSEHHYDHDQTEDKSITNKSSPPPSPPTATSPTEEKEERDTIYERKKPPVAATKHVPDAIADIKSAMLATNTIGVLYPPTTTTTTTLPLTPPDVPSPTQTNEKIEHELGDEGRTKPSAFPLRPSGMRPKALERFEELERLHAAAGGPPLPSASVSPELAPSCRITMAARASSTAHTQGQTHTPRSANEDVSYK